MLGISKSICKPLDELHSEQPRNAMTSTRLAVVGDFLEEHWHSMDLVADMLLKNLSLSHATEFHSQLLRPRFRRYLTWIPCSQAIKGVQISERILNRFQTYPPWLRRRASSFELFHIVDHSYAHLTCELPGSRTVVTCHDVDAFRALMSDRRSLRNRLLRALAGRILIGLQRAARVICDSITTRDELLAQRWMPPEKLTIVPLGVDTVCSPLPDSAARQALQPILGAAMDKLKI